MNDRKPSGRTNWPSDAKSRVLPPVDARQGVALGHMRYVLGISVTLAVVAFAVIYFAYF
ncbi:MAG TPA: hypothetical protein VG274_11805 [Rhizomicrobium sp.]|jgi:hypothetical protein|nr:hypothetical protein [Rhizomicrobium sp.]